MSLTDKHTSLGSFRSHLVSPPLLLVILTGVFGAAAAPGPPTEKNPGHIARVQHESRSRTMLLPDLEGRLIDPFQPANVKARVFIFLSNECPIANRYAPEIRRLYAQFASNAIPFWLVHPDPGETVASIAKHMKDYQLTCGVLRDPQHVLVKRSKVRMTPEAAVFGADGRLLYHGRIDNWYVDFGKARVAATQHDLQNALEAIVEGKPIRVKATRAVGCYIPKLQ